MTTNGLEVVGSYLWERAYGEAVDRLTSERFGIGPEILMELAGRGVADAVLDLGAEDAPIIVLAGSGNNGGDALVAARWLFEAGLEVHVFLIDADKAASPLNQRQRRVLEATGRRLERYKPGALTAFANAEPLVIDGVLGLGFRGPMSQSSTVYQALIEAANLPEATVIAIDMPSGLDADSGEAQVVPLSADLTVTFGGLKPAHVLSPARDVVGEVVALEIGFPEAACKAALTDVTPLLILPEPQALLAKDPWSQLPRSAHKYDRGHVLVIGGSPGMTGAPLLAAMSAIRTGAGWVTLALPKSARDSLRGEVPRELVFEDLFDGETLAPLKLERFLKERKVRAIVAGPGTKAPHLGKDLLQILSEHTESEGGIVIDAGETQQFLARAGGLSLNPSRWLLTPHPGEWRQLGLDLPPPLTRSQISDGLAAAEKVGVALFYKHATPILLPGIPGSPAYVVAEGTVALARAGTGDVLSGVAAAHLAIGFGAAEAGLRAQVQVAWAARLAAERRGEHGVLARDIMADLGRVTALLEEGDGEEGGDDPGEDFPLPGKTEKRARDFRPDEEPPRRKRRYRHH